MNDRLPFVQTRFAALSSPARSAIATIWISGEKSAEAINRCFKSRSGMIAADFTVGAICFGYWTGVTAHSSTGAGSTVSSETEGVVVCRTGQTEYEVHCHGGIAAQTAIANDLTGIGLRQLDWTEVASEFATNQIQAEANAALSLARTDRTAAILLEQKNGALHGAIVECISLIEQSKLTDAAKVVDELMLNAKVGLHLVVPWRIVIAGRPNVGKSSLINRLLGYQRAIVFDQAGTTRDVTRSTAAFDGWPVELSDTAGLRKSEDEIEAEGVNRAAKEMKAGDFVVLVFDWSDAWTDDDRQLLENYPEALVVFNKTDLVAFSDDMIKELGEISTARSCISVSTMTGAGLPELIRAIGEAVVESVPPKNAPVPFTHRQVSLLHSAGDLIRRQDASQAVQELNRIIGKPNSET